MGIDLSPRAIAPVPIVYPIPRRCLVEGLVSASWRQQPVVAKKESCFEDIRLFVIKVRIFHDNMISAVVLSHFPREIN